MFRHLRRLLLGFCLLALLAIALGLAVVINSDRALADVTAQQKPSIVRELPGKRTEYSTTYLFSDGSFSSTCYQSPVHFQDANGDWQPIDASLVLVPGTDTYATAAAPVKVTLADEAPGQQPVTVEAGKYAVTMDLVGCPEDGKLVLGDAALYSGVAPDTDVTYTALGDGIKEVITLTSGAAPNLFTYRLTHAGLTAKLDEGGQWGLYAAGAAKPAFLLGAMNACDSSLDESGEPAWCGGAQMTVTPGKGASTVTFSVPRAWLSDPARVYPVKIDPGMSTANPTDTYISSGYPGTPYGSDESLFCGRVSTATGDCKALVKFPSLDSGVDCPTIPDGAHISDATFQIRQFWQPATHDDTVYVDRVSNDSTNWGEASTWSSSTINVESMSSPTTTAEQEWVSVACPGVVQGWERDDYANKGFVLHEASTAGASWARKFRSGEYSDPDYRPNITVHWDQPTATVSAPAAGSTTRIGDTVSVVVDVGGVNDATQVDEIRMGVNRTDTDTTRFRGVMAWFRDRPAAPWVSVRKSLHNFLAYYDSAAYGTDHITPDLTASSMDFESVPVRATFAFSTNDSFGNTQDNDFDTYLALAAGSNTWSSGWVARDRNVDVRPKPLTWLSSSTTASAWFTPTAQVPNDDVNGQGRGNVILTWTAAPGASGYYVNLWDGMKYDQVASTASTTWTSAGKGLFPTDTQVAAISRGYSGSPFLPGSGLDLRDNPNALYTRMLPSGASTATDYKFMVVPYNAGGALAVADNQELSVTLDNRSLPGAGQPANDPQHTTTDLGSWDGHSLTGELDSGKLTVDVTDLAIASYGPAAAISRTYSSGVTAAGDSAPGWFFSFRQNLAIGASQIVYTDAERQAHTFTGSGSTWTAPNGFLATLTQSGANWKLTFDDQSYLTFNSSGTLMSETDRCGNVVTYAWNGGNLTLTAANGQAILATFSGGKIQRATYTLTIDAQQVTRQVDYAVASPWSVTSYPGDAVQKRLVTYAYDATTRLASITQGNWPASGQSAIAKTLYNAAGKLTEIDYPDMFATAAAHGVVKSDAKATITYDSATQATVKRYGTVGGVASQVMTQEVDSWDGATGLLTSQAVGATSPTTTTYDYAADLQLAGGTTTASGGGTVSASTTGVDVRGDPVSETASTDSDDSVNQQTTYVYDSLHRVTDETVTQGPGFSPTTTHYTYDPEGNTTVEWRQLGSDYLSYVQRSFDGQGRLTMEKQLISQVNGTWAETDYSNFAANGQPQTTVAKAVALTHGGATSDLTQSATYDAFGNLRAATDWGGRTTATNTYDVAGNQLTTTDAAGVTTNTTYDCMGNATSSWRSASGTAKKADWTVTTFDPMGRALTVTTKLSDAAGTATTQSVVTSTYDGSGNQLTASDSTLGGVAEKWLYDQYGNVTKHWGMGVFDSTVDARAERSAYDAAGQVTGESDPGSTATPGSAGSTITTYDDAGQVLKVTGPDGSWTSYAYDGAGNKTAETTSAGSSGTMADLTPATKSYDYDLAGRLTSQTNASGLKTVIVSDLLGRQTGATGGAQAQTQTEYNTLGWVLQKVDASGVTDSMTYDAHGSVTSETVGTQGATVSVFDAATGRLSSRTDPNGNKLTCTYDAFGNVTEEKQQNSALTVLKDVTTTPDSLGRPTTVHETTANGGSSS